jgi:TrwC relaxase
VSTNVTLHAGHDVAYFTRGQGRGGCAGAMSYYTAAGEPPGEWAGKGAVALGLTGQVDPAVIGRLYQQNMGPGGELLVKRRQSKAAEEGEKRRSRLTRLPIRTPPRPSWLRSARPGEPQTRTRCRTST